MFQPDFNQLLAVLHKEKPDRPVLFEFFLNHDLYANLAGPVVSAMKDPLAKTRTTIQAFCNAGYDYVTHTESNFGFTTGSVHMEKTKSLNDGAMITDRASFESYTWNNPDDYPSLYPAAAPLLPNGMKFMTNGPCGVLENVMMLVGYDNLCYMIYEDPELAKDIFEQVGTRLYRYYERAVANESVGLLMINDDWGFNTQPFLSPKDMRKYVFPWHEAYVQLAHRHGKPAVLHSCGNTGEIIEDIISMGYDGKHSYEDNILPVEEAYALYNRRIAVLGGIDLDYVISKPKEEVYARSLAMVKAGMKDGGYALGTGNSVPYYVPQEQYFAMIAACNDLR